MKWTKENIRFMFYGMAITAWIMTIYYAVTGETFAFAIMNILSVAAVIAVMALIDKRR